MDKIDRLLEYIHRTNPEMTRQKLIEELGESDYSAKSIYFLAIQNSKIRSRNFPKTCQELAKNSHRTLIE